MFRMPLSDSKKINDGIFRLYFFYIDEHLQPKSNYVTAILKGKINCNKKKYLWLQLEIVFQF